MFSAETPTKFTPLNERYLSLEVNPNIPEYIDWSCLFNENKGKLHSIEIYNSGDKLTEIDLTLFLPVKNHLCMNDSLAVLIIRKVILTEKHIELLCQALPRTRCLQHLSLQECSLSDSCCKILCDSLLLAPSVTTLDLSGNNITVNGVKSIAKLLKHEELARGISCWMKSLRGRTVDKEKVHGLSRLTLNDNLISDEGLSYIVENLYDDIWIKAIDMQRCDVTDEGAELVMDLLGINKDISVFDLRGNSKISSWLLTTIMQLISRNQKALKNEGEEIWLSANKENTVSEPNQNQVKIENKWLHSRMNYECHRLRRTQSCLDRSNRRYGGAQLWKRSSVDQISYRK